MSLLNTNPKVSIIMGTFNCSKTIEKSITSIQCQSFKNWEFIIYDDGSKDNTLHILKTFEQNDSKIKIIDGKQNKGLGYALNQCIKVSRAPLLLRQDADDTSSPERLQYQLQFMNDHPEVSVFGTAATLFDDDKYFWGKIKPNPNPSQSSWCRGKSNHSRLRNYEKR